MDSPGDNLLAEFASAVDAVRCAVEIQRALKEKNAGLPEARRMEFRLGINVGDVVVEGGRLYGDGVNIAARLEGLSEPGGICISGTVHDQVENKLSLEYEYVGEQAVKNIARPVRVYRVGGELGAAAAPKGSQGQSPTKAKQARPRSGWRTALAVVGIVLLLGVGAGAIRGFYGRLFPALPDKPSIAVCPSPI